MASRAFLSFGARASLRRNTPRYLNHVARRGNASHVPQSKSSDMPWIVGSAIVFGPALLYLLSPSARKTAPHHDSKHGTSHHDEHPKTKKMTMKDAEGTEADVTSSVNSATAQDVPKAEGSAPAPVEPVVHAQGEENHPEASAKPDEDLDNRQAKAIAEQTSGNSTSEQTSESGGQETMPPLPQKDGAEPTDQGEVRKAARE